VSRRILLSPTPDRARQRRRRNRWIIAAVVSGVVLMVAGLAVWLMRAA